MTTTLENTDRSLTLTSVTVGGNNLPLATTIVAEWSEIKDMVERTRPMILPPPYERPSR